MKRIALLVLALGLGCAAAGGVNLLDDADFAGLSRVPESWTTGNARVAVDAAVTHGSRPSLRVTSPAGASPQWYIVRHRVPNVRAKTPYTISAWVKTVGLVKGSMAYLSLNCEANARRLAANDSGMKVTGDSDWRRIVHTVDALPAGTQSAFFVCCLYGSGTAYFADLQVEEGRVATDWSPSVHDVAFRAEEAERRAAARAWRASKGLDALPPGTPRIGVLDLGFHAGTNDFGCMSAPGVFLDALAPLGHVFRVTGEDLARKGCLARETMDLLVVPTGSAWPADAADALIAYLRAGGSLFTCGGYAFDKPVYFADGCWTTHTDMPYPAADTRIALAPASGWRPSTPPGEKATVVDVSGPDGLPSVEVRSEGFHLWATAAMRMPKGALAGKSLLSFRARSATGAKRLTLELDEQDGSRWQVHVPVTSDWTEYRFCPSDFANWHDSPAVGRGGPDDRLNFNAVTSVSFGPGPGEAADGLRMGVAFADLKAGVDPSAALRARKPPQINTRTARIRDAIHPLPTQVNAFDPSFELRHVARLAPAPALAGTDLPAFTREGPCAGLAAIAQLGVNGHGYDANRCAWHPILEAYAADGSDRGPAAAFVYHHSGTFAGSAWAIFGVDDVDLFPAGDASAAAFARAVARKLLDRFALNETTSSYACYRVGETARLQARVGNFGAKERRATVRFTLSDEKGRALGTRTCAVTASAGENTSVEAEWPVGPDVPDYVSFTAELLDEKGRVIDREPGAFVVWSPSVIAAGPKLTQAGSRFALDGRPGFWMGAQTYWGQTRPTVARSPMSFNRDFRQMRAMGLRFTRLFLPWTCEEDKRISDACVQLAQKHGIVIYHTQQSIDPMAEGEAFVRQTAHFREIAVRYRDVPGFMVDIRNEPVMKLPPSWDSAKRMRHWLTSCRAAAREGRPDVLVSVGWSQGWAGGTASKDPAWCTLDLDFTDRHYYGPPDRMFRDLKDVDMRALGKPLTMPECGAKCHPTFVKEDPWHHGDTDETYTARFRNLVSHAFGLGATALLSWHWRDPMEGLFPCGMVHATGVPRPTAALFSRMARTFGKLRLAENPPDVVIRLREEPRMSQDTRMAYLERAYAIDAALKYWGANWSKITESAAGKCSVKLVLDPEALPTDDAAALRLVVGEKLRAAGCAFTRRAEDPETLETFRVPGEGATGWVFWNGGESPVEARRGGHVVTVLPGHAGYLQIASDGTLQAREEF